jgi:hydroxymethylbilane synthase
VCTARTLEGGCKVPVGTRSTWRAGTNDLTLYGCVVSIDGCQFVDAFLDAHVLSMADADQLGVNVAALIRERGGMDILDAIRLHDAE